MPSIMPVIMLMITPISMPIFMQLIMPIIGSYVMCLLMPIIMLIVMRLIMLIIVIYPYGFLIVCVRCFLTCLNGFLMFLFLLFSKLCIWCSHCCKFFHMFRMVLYYYTYSAYYYAYDYGHNLNILIGLMGII